VIQQQQSSAIKAQAHKYRQQTKIR